MLTEGQRAALSARLRRGREVSDDRISRRPEGLARLPVSFAQEQLWVIDRLAPGQPTYNVPQAIRLTGPLDRAALGSAIDALAVRHEALRTRLVTGPDGEPAQVIDPPAPVAIDYTDLIDPEPGQRQAGLVTGPDGEPAQDLDPPVLVAADHAGLAGAAPAPGQDRLAGIIETETLRPFDLATGPLWRVRLIRLGDREHVLLVVLHHVIFDGWSAGVLLRDLAALYGEAASGEPSGLDELAIQFADYAAWERERLSERTAAELEGYWRGALAGLPAVPFPADRPRPVLEDFAGGLAERLIGGELAGELRELSRAHGTTLFVTLLAGLQALLCRYTGQGDLVVGTVTANRGRPELAPLIGFLVNTLPIRVDLSGDPVFGELLDRVRLATIGAYAHQDLPFARIVSALGPARDPSRAPVFQIALTYADRDTRPVRAAGVEFALTDLVVGIKAAKFDLDFSVEARAGGLWIECSYKTALFDEATVERLLGHLETLLRGAVADPGARLSQLSVLTGPELDRELRNDTAAAYPYLCVHRGFERQAALTPDAVAVEFGGERVSYRDLNELADVIARRLRAVGVGPEVLVGVCLGTGPLRLAALLGIWKAGGGYVPLDLALPRRRLEFMIADTGMSVIVTDEASAAGLPPAPSAIVTLLDSPHPEIGLSEIELPSAEATPANVAYVIYTSGSTGEPKGVVIEHRQAANFLYGMIDTWHIGPDDSALQFASLNFDASVQEMFMPLLAGGRVVLAPPEVLHSPRRLMALLADRAITFACLTPSVVGLLGLEPLPDLRVLMCGGEELPAELVGRWLRPGLRFVNDYGPTETTITATFAELRPDTPLPPPIGLPSPNYRAYVLDPHLNLVPIGVVGELHVGGAGVARGYLNRPGLTAARFIADPFVPGERLYKTGDLVRRRADGTIVYAGRVDNQVKLRGLRIELGEIEAALTGHPGVAQAVVLVAADADGNKGLVAYLRLVAGIEAVGSAELREYLSGMVPGYMVPARFIVVGEFPLNPSGKIDRAALRALDDEADSGPSWDRSVSSAPANEAEAVLCELFAAVLHRDVGPESDFFELGGHSLLAMRLLDLISRRTQADLAPAALFVHPTPRQLAADLRAAPRPGRPGAGRAPDRPIVPLAARAAGTDGLPGEHALILIHGVGGTVFDYAALAAGLDADFSVHGLQAPGLEAAGTTPATLTDLVHGYAKIIRSAFADGPYYLGGWSMGGVIAFEVARELEAAGGDVALLVLLDPPYAVPPSAPLTDAELAGQFVADVTGALGWAAPDRPDPADADGAAGQQLDWLASRLALAPSADHPGRRDAGRLDSGGPALAAQVSRRFEVFATHTALLAGYRPDPDASVRAPTVLVGATRSLNASASPGWHRHLAGSACTLVLDSDHYELLRPPLVSQVAAAIATSR
jgi:amino acid adenylation domain-containing protein